MLTICLNIFEKINSWNQKLLTVLAYVLGGLVVSCAVPIGLYKSSPSLVLLWSVFERYASVAFFFLGLFAGLKSSICLARSSLFFDGFSQKKQRRLEIASLLIVLCSALWILHEAIPLGLIALKKQEISVYTGQWFTWPIKFIVIAGFILLALQSALEIIKRVIAFPSMANTAVNTR